MSTETLLTKAEAARMLGIKRPTFYRHIEDKGISVVKDEKTGREKIDISELIRVYGSNAVSLALKPTEIQSVDANGVSKASIPSDHSVQDSHVVQIAVLEEKLKMMEEQKEQFKELFEQEREERKRATMLLTDQSNKEDDWQKAMKVLEKRIANQEQVAKEEKLKAQKILRQNMNLKKALGQERSKSFWQTPTAPLKNKRVPHENLSS